MKVGLNEEQLEFLKKKFGIFKADIVKMTIEQWDEIREKCFEIETDELLDFEENGGDCDFCDTDDYLLAASIIDAEYLE